MEATEVLLGVASLDYGESGNPMSMLGGAVGLLIVGFFVWLYQEGGRDHKFNTPQNIAITLGLLLASLLSMWWLVSWEGNWEDMGLFQYTNIVILILSPPLLFIGRWIFKVGHAEGIGV